MVRGVYVILGCVTRRTTEVRGASVMFWVILILLLGKNDNINN